MSLVECLYKDLSLLTSGSTEMDTLEILAPKTYHSGRERRASLTLFSYLPPSRLSSTKNLPTWNYGTWTL